MRQFFPQDIFLMAICFHKKNDAARPPERRVFLLPHTEKCAFRCSPPENLCVHEASAMTTVAVKGSLPRSTTGKVMGQRCGGQFLGRVQTATFIGHLIQRCINVLASV